MHAVVVHGDAVAHADGRDLEGDAAGEVDACLHGLGDLVEVVVAGDDVVAGVEDRDERAVHLFVGEAVGLKEAPVRGAGQALLYGIASKLHVPLAFCGRACVCFRAEKCEDGCEVQPLDACDGRLPARGTCSRVGGDDRLAVGVRRAARGCFLRRPPRGLMLSRLLWDG